jgi:chromosome segregation protein
MYLRRLEIQGFKTFAQKTVLEFLPDASGRRGVTAVVGPNGSGKSNIADSLRWVMGEQSMKMLRGKKSEDIIFSGTDKRSRSGFAEVTLTIENDHPSKLEESPFGDIAEVSITRRLYRDGNSEYEVNRQPARLQDVALLLAQCGVGQRSYSVIGQGMVDHVLVASPAERKEFFDEAFGLRPFQLKRQSALQKITAARENLAQTEALLREISPRLTMLERQAKRLEEREKLEGELHDLERAYYGHGWQEVNAGLERVRGQLELARAELATRETAARTLEDQMRNLEQSTPIHEGFQDIRRALDKLSEERAALRERELKLETKRAVAAVRAEKPWSPLPLSKIIETIQSLHLEHESLERALSEKNLNPEAIRLAALHLKQASLELLNKLQRPAPEPETAPTLDPEVEREAKEIRVAMQQVTERMKEAEARLEAWNREEQDSRKHIFALQHDLNRKRQDAQASERIVNEASIELARLETRKDAFLNEVRRFAPDLESSLSSDSPSNLQPPTSNLGDAPARLQRLRSQLEWIGGIDPETIKEYQDTKDRFGFLSKQVEDLRETLSSLDEVIRELDVTIRERGDAAFARLNQEFGIYFKKLFGGGEASIIELKPEEENEEDSRRKTQNAEIDEDAAALDARPTGMDILVTPPGKRFKSIALLSGGERALTSIALICAIMATNPSPFVVLDEVDAALDESNSRKFAEILGTISDKTQCIVVTHNRATMTQASLLYGVTMGEEGTSQLLSVKLEDVEKMREKK